MRSKVAKRILEDTSEETKIFVNLYTDILVRVNQLLKEKGLNQKKLAQKMDKRPSEINKWLKGNHNLTLKTIAKMQAELGSTIICVPKKEEFISTNGNKRSFIVHTSSPVKKNTEFNVYSIKNITNTHQQLANVG